MSAQRPRFTYIGHATVRCDMPGGEVVLIDPWVGNNPSCPAAAKELDRIDAILCTHGHFDHIGDAVELAKRYEPRLVVGGFEVCAWLEKQGVKNTAPMNPGGSRSVLGHRVSMVRADHSGGITDTDGSIVYGGVASGYVVRTKEGFTFYHAGDTALFTDMQLIGQLHRPELAFLPVGDLFTMDPRQAAWACRFLEIRRVVPIHWGTFPALTGTPDQLARELDEMGVQCEVTTLQPGEVY